MSFWSILVDIIFVALFVWVIVFFTKYGFDRSVEKIGKAWLSLALTLIIGPWITGLLEEVLFNDLITNAVYGTLLELIEHNPNGYNLAELFASMPENFVGFLDSLGASLSALEAEFGSYTEASDVIIRTMAERIAAPCISLISTFIGLFIGFLVPFFFFKWLKYEIEKDGRHSFFAFTDKAGGFLVGVIGGYFLVMALSLFVKTAFQVIVAFDASRDLMPIYQSSFVFRFLAEVDVFGAGRALLDTVLAGFDSIGKMIK